MQKIASQEFEPTPRQVEFIQNDLFARGFLDWFRQKFNEWNSQQRVDQPVPTEEEIAEDAARFVIDIWLSTPKDEANAISEQGINMAMFYIWLYRTYVEGLRNVYFSE